MVRFPQGAACLQGLEVRLTIDEAVFAQHSVFVFAQVMARFFACLAPAGSFTRLVVLTASGAELVRCGARASGVLPV